MECFIGIKPTPHPAILLTVIFLISAASQHGKFNPILANEYKDISGEFVTFNIISIQFMYVNSDNFS